MEKKSLLTNSTDIYTHFFNVTDIEKSKLFLFLFTVKILIEHKCSAYVLHVWEWVQQQKKIMLISNSKPVQRQRATYNT